MPLAYVGIDLGTTNTTCGVVEIVGGGDLTYRQLKIPQLHIDSLGELGWLHSEVLPSVVWLAHDEHVYTGALCVDQGELISHDEGSRVIHGIKGELGNRHWIVDHNGQSFGPAEISACVLRNAWVAVINYVNERKKVGVVVDIAGVIITIPSSFSSTMRHHTLRAAQMAGLPMQLVSLVDEPIAALFAAYESTRAPFAEFHTDEPILVFDMGGGTVDVSILSVRPADRVVAVHATSRYNQVAGDDLDLEIAAYLWRHLRDHLPHEPLTRASALALLRAGEAVKIHVNEAVRATSSANVEELRNEHRRARTVVDVTLGTLDASAARRLTVPVSDVLDLVLPFLAPAHRATNFGRNIFTPIDQALRRAGLQRQDIRCVYVTGGGAKFRPVTLELEAYFRTNLSDRLDPTFAVSTGAAWFAALAATAGWKAAETTTERVYLRRNGEAFLEVLPDKLPIPSPPLAPTRPLEGNDTLELEHDSRHLRLEFFQGSDATDPDMRLVYATTRRYTQALVRGTTVQSMLGHVDGNKVYHFAIELKEPDGRVIRDELSFAAATADTAVANGPTYDLNNRSALNVFLGAEPMRSRLERQRAVPPTGVKPTHSDAHEPMAPARSESLVAERNEILRALNAPWADAYMGDKYLPTRMSATLSSLQRLDPVPGVETKEVPHEDLKTLYREYGATAIRSLLDFSFLLYGRHDLKSKLGPLVALVSDDLKYRPERVQVFLNDLDYHADSPFAAARELTRIVLGAARSVPGVASQILSNGSFCVQFKLMAVEVLAERRDAADHLLSLLVGLRGLSSDEFNWVARPVIAALAGTGAAGFDAAVRAYDRKALGNAGPLVLSSFVDQFHNWAMRFDALPERYVAPLFLSFWKIEGNQDLDRLVYRLLDRWVRDRSVNRDVVTRFARMPAARREDLCRRLTPRTRDLIESVMLQANADPPPTDGVRKAATTRDAGALGALLRHRRLAEAVAEVVRDSSVGDAEVAFLLEFAGAQTPAIQRILIQGLVSLSTFGRLSESRQRLILEWPPTNTYVDAERLDRVKEVCAPPLVPMVNRMVADKWAAKH